MEIKEAQERYYQVRNSEEVITLKYVNELFKLGVSHIDISNHYIFTKSGKVIRKMFQTLIKKRLDIHSIVMQNCMLDSDKLARVLAPVANSRQ
jgi:hypothetical protein